MGALVPAFLPVVEVVFYSSFTVGSMKRASVRYNTANPVNCCESIKIDQNLAFLPFATAG